MHHHLRPNSTNDLVSCHGCGRVNSTRFSTSRREEAAIRKRVSSPSSSLPMTLPSRVPPQQHNSRGGESKHPLYPSADSSKLILCLSLFSSVLPTIATILAAILIVVMSGQQQSSSSSMLTAIIGQRKEHTYLPFTFASAQAAPQASINFYYTTCPSSPYAPFPSLANMMAYPYCSFIGTAPSQLREEAPSAGGGATTTTTAAPQVPVAAEPSDGPSVFSTTTLKSPEGVLSSGVAFSYCYFRNVVFQIECSSKNQRAQFLFEHTRFHNSFITAVGPLPVGFVLEMNNVTVYNSIPMVSSDGTHRNVITFLFIQPPVVSTQIFVFITASTIVIEDTHLFNSNLTRTDPASGSSADDGGWFPLSAVEHRFPSNIADHLISISHSRVTLKSSNNFSASGGVKGLPRPNHNSALVRIPQGNTYTITLGVAAQSYLELYFVKFYSHTLDGRSQNCSVVGAATLGAIRAATSGSSATLTLRTQGIVQIANSGGFIRGAIMAGHYSLFLATTTAQFNIMHSDFTAVNSKAAALGANVNALVKADGSHNAHDALNTVPILAFTGRVDVPGAFYIYNNSFNGMSGGLAPGINVSKTVSVSNPSSLVVVCRNIYNSAMRYGLEGDWVKGLVVLTLKCPVGPARTMTAAVEETLSRTVSRSLVVEVTATAYTPTPVFVTLAKGNNVTASVTGDGTASIELEGPSRTRTPALVATPSITAAVLPPPTTAAATPLATTTPQPTAAPGAAYTRAPEPEPAPAAVGTTVTTGIVGVSTSPMSGLDSLMAIQVMSIFASMACRVPGVGGDSMQTFLNPLEVGGDRYGKLVGQVILVAIIAALYAIVLGVLAHFVGYVRASDLLRHPRAIPMVHQLVLSGFAFQCCMLLYGNDDITGDERFVGAVGLLLCLASVLAYPLVTWIGFKEWDVTFKSMFMWGNSAQRHSANSDDAVELDAIQQEEGRDVGAAGDVSMTCEQLKAPRHDDEDDDGAATLSLPQRALRRMCGTALEDSYRPYTKEDLALVWAPLRWTVTPKTYWLRPVLRTSRCVHGGLRPDRSRLAVAHHLYRAVLVCLVCTIPAQGEDWCVVILAIAAAICFAHACFILFTMCYRVPMENIAQSLQSAVVGAIALSNAVGAGTDVATSLAFVMLAGSMLSMGAGLSSFMIEWRVLSPAVVKRMILERIAAEEEEGDVRRDGTVGGDAGRAAAEYSHSSADDDEEAFCFPPDEHTDMVMKTSHRLDRSGVIGVGHHHHDDLSASNNITVVDPIGRSHVYCSDGAAARNRNQQHPCAFEDSALSLSATRGDHQRNVVPASMSSQSATTATTKPRGSSHQETRGGGAASNNSNGDTIKQLMANVADMGLSGFVFDVEPTKKQSATTAGGGATAASWSNSNSRSRHPNNNTIHSNSLNATMENASDSRVSHSRVVDDLVSGRGVHETPREAHQQQMPSPPAKLVNGGRGGSDDDDGNAAPVRGGGRGMGEPTLAKGGQPLAAGGNAPPPRAAPSSLLYDDDSDVPALKSPDLSLGMAVFTPKLIATDGNNNADGEPRSSSSNKNAVIGNHHRHHQKAAPTPTIVKPTQPQQAMAPVIEFTPVGPVNSLSFSKSPAHISSVPPVVVGGGRSALGGAAAPPSPAMLGRGGGGGGGSAGHPHDDAPDFFALPSTIPTAMTPKTNSALPFHSMSSNRNTAAVGTTRSAAAAAAAGYDSQSTTTTTNNNSSTPRQYDPHPHPPQQQQQQHDGATTRIAAAMLDVSGLGHNPASSISLVVDDFFRS